MISANAGNGILATERRRQPGRGISPADGNIVCGNGTNGIRVRSGATGRVVRGNRVGIRPSGPSFAVLGNGEDGIQLNDGATETIVGGKAAGAGNVVSGNLGAGLHLADDTTTGNVVQGNFIGTDGAGNSPAGNAGPGVWIEAGAHDNKIGGAASGAGNTIAFNGGDGVFVEDGEGNAILGNLIRSNAGLGIDLAPTGSHRTTPETTTRAPTGFRTSRT